MKTRVAAIFLAGMVFSASPSGGQQVIPAPAPAIGDLAPDFTLPGATRYGQLRNPIKLSDFRGSTVVLAFFYQARTKG